ncbi:EamA/RhaT family transporter [Pseudolabrys taiwanensis]|uniref:EamA/RhaT family transporter n=1 Tax=Pseudolabrys taiwanensis TaxID=331696 RepID=A0A346A0C4_9HYPH|nr:DMT family transporter [Pseudolabrys taiwanensis]AXK82621.1 EamA/RhaT family transporter [Pseudolabrys taiwanensis]
MPHADMKAAGTGTAKLLILPLAFAWGFMWIATAIGLREIPLWTLRFVGTGLGALTLFAFAALSGVDLRVPRGERLHVAITGFFNVALFNLMAAFAQMTGATSRVVIVTYSMPIWAALFSRFMLGERLDTARHVALGLCCAGLLTLMWPQIADGLSPSVFLALGCALSWAFASVYLKWAKVKVAPLANAAWQLAAGTAVITVGMLIFDHYPRIWPLHLSSLLAIVYIGLIGVGLAHFLWWSIIGKVSPVTASIGALLVPVIGVVAATLFLGERPTASDVVGFILIFAAAACVLLQPAGKSEMAEQP